MASTLIKFKMLQKKQFSIIGDKSCDQKYYLKYMKNNYDNPFNLIKKNSQLNSVTLEIKQFLYNFIRTNIPIISPDSLVK